MALAYGKVILVGEHAVVYGVPAIALGVNVAATASARVAQRSSLTLGVRRWDLGRRGGEPTAAPPDAATPEARAFGELIACVAGGAGPPPEIEAEVLLHQPSGVGLGASGAIAVALARAVSDAIGKPSELRPAAELLAAAQAWENVFHGKASGIDAATAYHGGCLWFRQREPVESLRLQSPLRLAVAVAGPAVSTRLMVESVAAGRERNPQRFELSLQSIHAIVQEARAALLLGRWKDLGVLLDRNHRLLSELGVSTPALDAACQQARDAGALGAKLTGGGGGGCVLALTEAESTERVLSAWRQQGLHCFEATVPGVAAGDAPAG